MTIDGYSCWQEYWLNNPEGRTQQELKEACNWAAGRGLPGYGANEPKRKWTCFAQGCQNIVDQGKTFYQDLHMTGYNLNGLDVRCMVKLCKECDIKLHKTLGRDEWRLNQHKDNDE